MERLEIVKNPFDPSLKADSSTASSRINTDSGAISGMNPPAPEPSSQTGSSSKPGGGGEGGGGGGSGPDYAALLQYLQYYQKQLGPDEGPAK